MKLAHWTATVAVFLMVGCATSEQGRVFESVSQGSTAFEIYAGADEVVGATRVVAETLGLVVLAEDPETHVLQLGSSDGSLLFTVSIESRERQLRVVTAYDRVRPGARFSSDEVSTMSRQMNELSDAILEILVNLPPATPFDTGVQSPSSA